MRGGQLCLLSPRCVTLGTTPSPGLLSYGGREGGEHCNRTNPLSGLCEDQTEDYGNALTRKRCAWAPSGPEVTRDRICSLTGEDGVSGQVPMGLHFEVTSVT